MLYGIPHLYGLTFAIAGRSATASESSTASNRVDSMTRNAYLLMMREHWVDMVSTLALDQQVRCPISILTPVRVQGRPMPFQALQWPGTSANSLVHLVH